MDPLHGKPKIDYPCPWEFRVLGEDEAAMRSGIAILVGDRHHSLRPGNRKGRFLSLSLEFEVVSEEERDGWYGSLKELDGVRMVL